MNTIIDVLRNLHNAVSSVWRLLRYLLSFVGLMLQPKAVLVARVLALQSQIAPHRPK